jgi:SAM-dependent methyltransferase
VSAAESWRRQLDEWRIPDELLKAVPDSPYGWPQHLWKRRAEQALESDHASPTLAVVRKLVAAGSVLDVGAGTGRASLPLVRDGYLVTMVEPNPTMLETLSELKGEQRFQIVRGRWPEAKDQVAPHDVVLSAHVVYDVADIAPFLRALHDAAVLGVVLELTSAHPWVDLGPLYKELHNLDRPTGPTVEDLALVVDEVVGAEPTIERWSRETDMVFETVEEAVEFSARRLVLPRHRWNELEAMLAPRLVGRAGHWQISPTARQLCTLWWRK